MIGQRETKIWGSTVTLMLNPMVSFHRADVMDGYRCSVHKHDQRHNGFYVESGVIHVVVFNEHEGGEPTEKVRHVLQAGDFLSVEPGVYHRFECYQAHSVLFEIYWAAEVRVDDIQRLDEGGPL